MGRASAWSDRAAHHRGPSVLLGARTGDADALVLTIVVHPVFIGLRRRGVPSWLAMTVMLLAVFGIAVSLAFSMGQLATLLPSYQSRFAMLVNEATAALAEAGIGRDQVCAALSDLVFLLFGLIVAVLDGVAAWILGVPPALLWALAAFVIGLVPPALLVIAVYLDGRQLVGVAHQNQAGLGAYVVINFVIQSVAQPKFIGDAVDLLTSSKPAPAPQEG